MEALLIVVLGVVTVAGASAVGRRMNIASPLLLVVIGLVVSLLPFVPNVELDPNIILVGVLPPLLYSAAVSLPAIEFRRDFGPIAGLSVILVLLSSFALGLFFSWTIPGLGVFLAVAMGAILSPTDAVATSIVKKLGLSRRVITMLEGESLLNDATSLVILRTATVAVAAGSVSTIGAVGSFVWGVLVAIVIGAIVGYVAVTVRAWAGGSAAGTAIGLVVPFAAYLPTEELGGSGLVAAVVAGIVTGQRAARWFTPEQRMADASNWRTIELVLEGGVFLVMGLELEEIWNANVADNDGPLRAFALALAALAIVLIVRAAYVSLLVAVQGIRARGRQRERWQSFDEHLDAIERGERAPRRAGTDPARARRRMDSMRARIARGLADLDYYQSSPLGWKHGTVLIWGGMRGVVTLAAAQTLPRDTPERDLLILIAFLVAIFSLLIQGFTLPWLVRTLRLDPDEAQDASSTERARLDAELRVAAAEALQSPDLRDPDGRPLPRDLVEAIGSRVSNPPDEEQTAALRDGMRLRLAIIVAMRERLNSVSHDGTFSTSTLRHALAELDAEEISIQVRLDDE